ncbi:MAG: ABC transporter ATP-binding protein [Candidatus Bathyarchaeia archaeon]|nr:ABC transporter ATP-binding protein [Candidatus Bathyarchaeota archaeon]
MGIAVEASGLVKNYGRVQALRGCSFKVDEGEVFGLIGPNGAGKTTTLRIVGTLIKPTKGWVKVFGVDAVEGASEVRKMIGYLPEDAGAYPNLSGIEYLRFVAGFYSAGSQIDAIVDEGIQISGLGKRLGERIKGYSKGMTRRLLLARALMMRPRLAILDDPTAGLDIVHAHHIRVKIKEYVEKGGLTVLLSSHNMLEVEYLCDKVALIDRGIIIEEGKPEELKDRYGAENLEQVFLEATKIG